MAVKLVRGLVITIPRAALGILVFLLSIIATNVGKVGSLRPIQLVPHLPMRIIISPETARTLRDDFMMGMDGVAEELIDQHFGQGHQRELMSKEVEDKLRYGEFVDSKSYETGEFGVSMILTFVALSIVLLEIPGGLASALSIWIGGLTIVLLISVSSRKVVIDLLAYERPSNGSLVENTKRLAWNGAFLSRTFPLPYLLLLKIAGSVDDDFYRNTVYSLGVGVEQGVVGDDSLLSGFLPPFIEGMRYIISGRELPSDVPPAADFEYIS